MLYSYEWLHKATPADYRLVLMKDPETWFGYVTAQFYGALKRERPGLFEKLSEARP